MHQLDAMDWSTAIPARTSRIVPAPVAAVLLSAPALLSMLLPGLADSLELDRSAIAAGEWWRALTGHWAHWSLDHAVWDLSAFVLLIWLGWRASWRRTLVTLAAATVAIPAAVWMLLPTIERYRGLSGLDSALFVLVAVGLARRELADRSWCGVAIATLALTAFAGKVGYETWSGATLFADGTGFIPVPLAHLVGGGCGLAVALRPPRPAAPARHRRDGLRSAAGSRT